MTQFPSARKRGRVRSTPLAALGLLAVLWPLPGWAAAVIATWSYAVAQTSKLPPAQTRSRPPAGYQVDVRLRVSGELDKARLLRWIEVLRAAGVSGVSELSGTAAAVVGEATEPAVSSGGAGRVMVLGSIGPAGNLHIGTQAFRITDRVALEAFIKKLKRDGASGADPSAPMWGLGESQISRLRTGLKTTAAFDLQNQPLGRMLRDLQERVDLPIQFTPGAEKVVAATRVEAKTGQLSTGAALAYVLGLHGLAWEPRQDAAGELTMLVLTSAESKRPWPIGVASDQFPGTIAPQLMATARYETRDTPLLELLEALERLLKIDVLLDRASLAQKRIEPDQLRSTIVILGGTYQSAIRKTLSPLRLRAELRIDEADQPFLWVTAGEPTGPLPKPKGKAKIP